MPEQAPAATICDNQSPSALFSSAIYSAPAIWDLQLEAYQLLRASLPELNSPQDVFPFFYEGRSCALVKEETGGQNLVGVWDLEQTESVHKVAEIHCTFPVTCLAEIGEFDSRYILTGVASPNGEQHFFLTRLDFAINCYASGQRIELPHSK